jgi:hypothetical protein
MGAMGPLGRRDSSTERPISSMLKLERIAARVHRIEEVAVADLIRVG